MLIQSYYISITSHSGQARITGKRSIGSTTALVEPLKIFDFKPAIGVGALFIQKTLAMKPVVFRQLAEGREWKENFLLMNSENDWLEFLDTLLKECQKRILTTFLEKWLRNIQS
ncbi:hypothetical protein KJ836_03635 [Patescibacteria group bacterium]|nr:hypothetical protein [Patescibacteria group bacterium]